MRDCGVGFGSSEAFFFSFLFLVTQPWSRWLELLLDCTFWGRLGVCAPDTVYSDQGGPVPTAWLAPLFTVLGCIHRLHAPPKTTLLPILHMDPNLLP